MPRGKKNTKKKQNRSKPRSKSRSKARKFGGNGENDDENVDKIIKEVSDKDKRHSELGRRYLEWQRDREIHEERERLKREIQRYFEHLQIIDNPNEIRNINPNNIINRNNQLGGKF